MITKLYLHFKFVVVDANFYHVKLIKKFQNKKILKDQLTNSNVAFVRGHFDA